MLNTAFFCVSDRSGTRRGENAPPVLPLLETEDI